MSEFLKVGDIVKPKGQDTYVNGWIVKDVSIVYKLEGAWDSELSFAIVKVYPNNGDDVNIATLFWQPADRWEKNSKCKKELTVYQTNELGSHWVQGVDQVVFLPPAELVELKEEVACLLEDVKNLQNKYENSETFNPGDVVVLKSGGPRMVVNKIVYEKEEINDAKGCRVEDTSRVYGCKCNWFERDASGNWGDCLEDVFKWDSLVKET